MDSEASSTSSSPEPIAVKTVGQPKPKRVVSDKQREALKLGMAKLKEKREEMQREKDSRKKTNEELKAKGLPPIEPPIKIKKQDITELPKLEPVEIKVKERKVRTDKGMNRISAVRVKTDGIEELKKMVMELKQQQIAPQVAPQVREVQSKVLSGSDLLNKIFFA